ncbi:MAG: amidohydrolase family protein [Candidatus Bathyarchaeota archaeon]|jgi:N-acyl-D-aspartate/D-glutamate deacylase
MSEFDLLVNNARIVDGSGKPAYFGSIGVVGDRITALGVVEGDAKRVLDAEGLIASPGWIDAHSHSDHTILFYPRLNSYIMQGITTFVGGQCGGSASPLGDMIPLLGLARDHIQEIEPHKYYPEKQVYPREQVNEMMEEKFGWTVDWETMGEWFKRVEETGISLNMAPLVGHGTIRYTVMGNDYKRHSTEKELEEMKRLITEAMEEGCIGLSSGLDYDPSVWANMDEINECVEVLKDYTNAVYCPHWRRTGRRRDVKFGDTRSNKVDGILESIETCRKTGVPTHLAHLTPGWRLVPEGNDMMEEMNIRATLKFIDDAREEGLDLTYDSMPWFIFGGFGVMPYLSSLLTPWLREQGNREALAEWLKVPDYRKEVVDAIKEGKWFIRLAYNPNTNPQWAENIWVVKHTNPYYEDKTVEQIAEDLDKPKIDAYFDLIIEDPDARGVAVGVAESGNFPWKPYRVSFFKHPAGALSLDQSLVDHTRQQEAPPYSMPGINAFAAFPGFLAHIVRDKKLMSLEEAIEKMSTAAAKQHRLDGRGTLIPGSLADIVLFDLDALKVTGDPVEPRRYPEGIKHVFVNGVAVVNEGEYTGTTPGRILRRAD